MNKKIYEDLIKLTNKENVKMNDPLKKYTYTKTGGKGEIVVSPETYEEVGNIYKYGLENKLNVTIIGNGSNLLIKDGGLSGIVLLLTKMKDIKREGGTIIAQSGSSIIDVSRFAFENSLTGLEFACGIPGTTGGALYMNAGAYGGEISDIVSEALVLDKDGNLTILTKEEMDLGYRKSIFAKQQFVILEVRLKLESGVKSEIKDKMDDLTEKRASKQPLEYPSCGSVFKRPTGHFAGKLIQDSGLQGKQIGGAQVSEKHAGFIVNVGEATSSDYLELIKYIQDTVEDTFKVRLETEVKIIGEDRFK